MTDSRPIGRPQRHKQLAGEIIVLLHGWVPPPEVRESLERWCLERVVVPMRREHDAHRKRARRLTG